MADNPAPQEPAPAPAAQPDPPAPDGLGDGGKKALEVERTARREAEQNMKSAQKELEKIRAASLSESEKAIAEAEARGRSAAATTYGQRLAGAEFVAAAAKRNPGFDASAVLGDLNLTKYVGEDGEPDSKGITSAVERLVPAVDPNPRPRGDVGFGPRETPPTPTDGTARSLIAAGIAASDAAKR